MKLNLNSAVVVMAAMREAERTERSIGAIETVHVTLALVRIDVHLALHEELRREQWLQPWRPPLLSVFLHLFLPFSFFSLINYQKNIPNFLNVKRQKRRYS